MLKRSRHWRKSLNLLPNRLLQNQKKAYLNQYRQFQLTNLKLHLHNHFSRTTIKILCRPEDLRRKQPPQTRVSSMTTKTTQCSANQPKKQPHRRNQLISPHQRGKLSPLFQFLRKINKFLHLKFHQKSAKKKTSLLLGDNRI